MILIRVPRVHNGERIPSSIDVAGEIGYQHTKE
jgi:hypothetical protein